MPRKKENVETVPYFVLARKKKGECPSVKERLQKERPKEMSIPEKEILCMMLPECPELPYPLQDLPMAYGPAAREYVIPDDKRAEVLQAVCPFALCPDLEEEMYDIHEDKCFMVRDFRVIRERGRNMLVSPYYPISGGMIVDWVPKAHAKDNFYTEEAKKA